jgi:hypothetical protein
VADLHIYPEHDGSDYFPHNLPAMWRTGAPLGSEDAYRCMWQDGNGVAHGASIGEVYSEEEAVEHLKRAVEQWDGEPITGITYH